jgi:CheY-like chemotaxis protein
MKRTYTPTKPKKILIVDDDETVANTYRNKLQSERFKVEIANSGEDALRSLRKEPVDLVILDFSLPGMNGAEILRTIRSPFDARALPIIAFTNFYLPGVVQDASKAGATRCVRKSDCTPRAMVEIVREALAMPQTIASGTRPDEILSGSETRADFLEMEYQEKLVSDFLAGAPQKLGRVRTGHHALVNSKREDVCLAELFEMRRQARLLAGAASLPGFREIAQLADALEALFIRLYAKPANITPSVIRTIGQAIDLLSGAFDSAIKPATEMPVPPTILVVDDEVISREAICSAIERANLSAVSLDDPMVAEGILQKTHFDLIFLDVEMPGQSGLDLCAKIRKMTTNRATPVVFVTVHCDFESRARSVLSGGNDFIAKPFLSVELAVKALVWLFRGKVQPLLTARPANVEDHLVELPTEPARSNAALTST